MKKETRVEVYNKYGGHCAYCGKKIEYKDMQVDHIKAKKGVERGTDDIENLNPSCRACNFRKGTMSIGQFRKEIVRQCEGIVKRSFQVRQSIDYGLIKVDIHPILFYFEKHDKENG